jgi:ABC-2 type transport system permease protein
MRVVFATMRTAFLEAWTNRRSFWLQVTMMMVNDLVWIAFWVLLFNKVGDVRGWDGRRIVLLYAILTTAAGLALGLLANARRVGRMAIAGELDPVLTLPVRPLVYLLTKRVDTSNLGDLIFGPVLFFALSGPTLERTAIYVVGSLASATVLIAFLVFLGSLTLLISGIKGEQTDLGFQAVLIFSSYPLDIFGGATKFVLYTAVPAAFVTGLPVRLVDDFDLATFGALLGAAAFMAALAAYSFKLGLRRYSSGALWTRV